ncbi:O-antigen ligase family protein [Streptomyces sp. NPDC007861]|uniref:O-antigen ligase family protein n=1 Tax=Streptomyces sp. NPDC007861 TaxID=3154893 RepID=UPI0033D94D6F
MRSRFAVVLGWTGLLAAAPAVVYLVLFHGTLTAAVAVAACFTLLVWPRPDLALLVLLALVPVAAVADPTGAAAVALVTGAVALLLLRTVVLSGLRVRADLVVIVLMAFVVTASYLLPQVALTVERQWKGYVLLLVALGLLVVSAAAPADPLRIAQVVAIAGACAAGYLLLHGEYAADRLTGLGLNPNYAGAMLALPLVAAAGLARLHRSWLWLLPALVCGAAILQTRSRGTFLMVAAGLACVVLVGRPLRHKVLIALSLAGVALALPGTLDVVGENLTGSRTSTELTSNTEVRKQAAWLAARVALEHPLRGIGYGVFPDYARTSSELGIYINTHNDLLRLAAEAGIGALALFTVLLWLGLARRHAPHQAILQSMGVAYVVGLLFANTLTHVIVTAPFWVCLGCLLAQPRHTQPTTTPSPTSLLSVRKT